MSDWVHGQEILLSQGYFFNQTILSQGYPIENCSPTPQSKIFSEYTPPGSQPSLDCADKSKIKNYKDEKFIFFLFG